MTRKATIRKAGRHPGRRVPVKPTLSFEAKAAAHREIVEYAKSGVTMMVWWFNPAAGERYIRPNPANPGELVGVHDRLRMLAKWLRDIAAEVETRLEDHGATPSVRQGICGTAAAISAAGLTKH